MTEGSVVHMMWVSQRRCSALTLLPWVKFVSVSASANVCAATNEELKVNECRTEQLRIKDEISRLMSSAVSVSAVSVPCSSSAQQELRITDGVQEQHAKEQRPNERLAQGAWMAETRRPAADQQVRARALLCGHCSGQAPLRIQVVAADARFWVQSVGEWVCEVTLRGLCLRPAPLACKGVVVGGVGVTG